jgi:hypothetical protein
MSTPSTNIYLCSGVPLNNKYDHTLYFSNPAAQLQYFRGKNVKTFVDYTYVRKSWKLKVAATMEEARTWSYLFFQNGAGKMYYYFVNQIEYISDFVVELALELDVMQTYMFDWELRPCYVEREHSVNDTYGENTLDEGLDVGEMITAFTETIDLSSKLVIMTAATMDINAFYITQGATERLISGSIIDNIFGGFQVTATPETNRDGDNSWLNLATMLNYLDTKGKTDAIFTMWEFPEDLVNYNNGEYEEPIARYVTGSKYKYFTASSRPFVAIDGYAPKNNKLFQFPYCFLYATNNNGSAAVYHYEKFASTPSFRIQGNIAPDAVVKLVPEDYKGVDYNYDESLSMGSYPLCSWNSDPYKMWLAQNQNQQTLSMGTAALQIAGGTAALFTGAGASAGVGMIASGAMQIGGQLAQRADMDIQPPQARGSFAGSHNLSKGIHNFDLYHKTIDAYHAEVIDNYFSMYGYATRKVKTPNISSRPLWNYVKTINSNIGGNFCTEDLNTINAIFDRGITFWHTPNVGVYNFEGNKA